MYNNTGNSKISVRFFGHDEKVSGERRSSLDGYRFTPNETAMMIYMLKHPEIDTAKDIARNLGISQSLICRSVDSLTRKGLIDVVKDSEDRRVNHLTLNIKEKSLKNTLLSMDPDFEKQMTEGVAADDLAVFQRVISRMAANVGAV